MEIPKQAQLLRIFIGEAQRYDGKPLYEAIVLKARELHLAGATVLRGGLGYGHSSHLQTAKILRLSDDLPLVVERPHHAGEHPGAAVRPPARDLKSLMDGGWPSSVSFTSSESFARCFREPRSDIRRTASRR